MEIVFFAHSITKDNESGNATGWLQGELSEEGIKRARSVASQVSGQQFDAVFCSDLRRAIDSTKIFFEEKFPTYIDLRLRECNYGDYDGNKAADFKKNREHEYIDSAYPGGESYKDVEARMASFLRM